jgi:hypothetical protein
LKLRFDHDTPPECRAELQLDLELTSKDYRLKYGINHECTQDMEKLCHDEMMDVEADSATHGGAVLSCLVKRRNEISRQACKWEVRRYQRQVMDDWKNSVDVKSACSADVSK